MFILDTFVNQTTNSNCAQAALAMVIGDKTGTPMSIDQASQAMGESSFSNLEQVVAGLRTNNLNGEIKDFNNFENDPNEKIVDVKGLYPGVQAHAVVVTSINKDTGTANIKDPGSPSPTTVPLAILEQAMLANGGKYISIT